MTDWWSNPLVYIVGAGTLGGAIYAAVRGLLAVGEWKGRTDGSVSAIKDAIQTIQEDIKKVLLYVRPESASESPLRLTDLGQELSEGVGGRSWAQSISADLAESLRNKEEFEIHEYASEYVRDDSRLSEDMLLRIRKCAYQRGVDQEKVRNVLAIELRDAILNRLDLSA